MNTKHMIRDRWRSLRRSVLQFKWEQRYVAALHYKGYQNLRNHPGIHSLQPFDENRCIFIHVPKNGGIAIANGLFGKDRMLGGHYSVDFYKSVFGPDFDAYFKFAITRNPWDRLVSAFHYLKQGGLDFRDREWEQRHIAEFKDFGKFVEEWVTPKNIFKGMHFTPQSQFICDSGGNVAVDYLGRFENFSLSYSEIRKRLDMGDQAPPHSNKSDRQREYRSYYNDRQAQIVADVYRTDIDVFGYSF